VETLCLFSGLSNKKSRGSTQATTAATATATAATTPSKKRKRLTRRSQRAGAIHRCARFISLGWRIKDCLAARLG
jgi:hypothetical protein